MKNNAAMEDHWSNNPRFKAEQEPVAWMNAKRDMTYLHGPYNADDIPLYTTPPQRTWVGLTDDDKKTPDMGKYVFLSDDWIDGYKTGLEKGEAKLKEKNA